MSRIGEIEKGVPLPKTSPLPETPLGEMEVGDSIALEGMTAKSLNTMRGRIVRFYRKHPFHRFGIYRDKTTRSKTAYRLFRLPDRKEDRRDKIIRQMREQQSDHNE